MGPCHRRLVSAPWRHSAAEITGVSLPEYEASLGELSLSTVASAALGGATNGGATKGLPLQPHPIKAPVQMPAALSPMVPLWQSSVLITPRLRLETRTMSPEPKAQAAGHC